jgi:hypothetical protein
MVENRITDREHKMSEQITKTAKDVEYIKDGISDLKETLKDFILPALSDHETRLKISENKIKEKLDNRRELWFILLGAVLMAVGQWAALNLPSINFGG